MDKRIATAILTALPLLLAGCSLLGGAASPAVEPTLTPTATAQPTATLVALAPTLAQGPISPPTLTPSQTPGPGTPTAEGVQGGQAPTALPQPTQIAPATATAEGSAAGETSAAPAASSGPGITLSPQLGEPGETVVVNGSGFAPNSHISFYWTHKPNDALGKVYYETDADDNGAFQIGLIVLPGDRWPGGPPTKQGDDIWLVATSDAQPFYRYYAQYLYLPRTGQNTLVLKYTNTDYGYSIGAPNGWTWSWQGDDTTDVRFQSPSGSGKGFVRVVASADVNAVIASVMGQEFAGQTYTTATGSAGTVPATRVTASNGRVAFFAVANGRTYVISFVGDDGKPQETIMGSFKLK
jgi:hypothetical protein